MAKARMIYSSLSTDEQIASLSFKAMFLWPWMLPHCSDQGRLLANPLKIKLVVVPGVTEITPQDIEAILQEYASKGLIILYTVSSQNILQIKNWWKYQKLQWAYPDDLPPPDGWQDKLRYWHDRKIVIHNWPGVDDTNGEPKTLEEALDTFESLGEGEELPAAVDSPQVEPSQESSSSLASALPSAVPGARNSKVKSRINSKTNSNQEVTGASASSHSVAPSQPEKLTKPARAVKPAAPEPPPVPPKPVRGKPFVLSPLLEPYRVAYCEGLSFDPALVVGKQVEKLAPGFLEAQGRGIPPDELANLLRWWAGKPNRKRYGAKDLEYALEDYAYWVSLGKPPQWHEGNGSRPASGRAMPDRKAGDSKHYSPEEAAKARAAMPPLEVEWAGIKDVKP